jgi:hypothetical protein
MSLLLVHAVKTDRPPKRPTDDHKGLGAVTLALRDLAMA